MNTIWTFVNSYFWFISLFYQESPSVDYSSSSLQMKRSTLRERSALREISELKERSRSRSRSRVLRTSHGKCFFNLSLSKIMHCALFYNDLETLFPLVGGGEPSNRLTRLGCSLWKTRLKNITDCFQYYKQGRYLGYPIWSTWQFF